MFWFFAIGAIPFLILGPYLIIGGIRRPDARKRMVYSGTGSIVLGAGQLLLSFDAIAGLVLIGAGGLIIMIAIRMRVE